MKKKIFGLGKKFITHELISGSFYIFLGSLLSNILAFLFNLFLARNLSTVDYGIYASLISVITLIGIPAVSITTSIVRYATDYLSSNQNNKASKLYKITFGFTSVIAVFIMLIFTVFSIPIKNFLHIDNTFLVVFSGLIVAVGYLSITNTAFLQGLLKFTFISITMVIGGMVKLFIGVLLIILGFKVFGGLFAIFAMYAVSFLLGFIPLKFIFKKIKTNGRIPIHEIISYAVPTSLTVLSLTSLTSMDIILVKHFFSPGMAGIYAGISLIGRVIFYFTGPITMVMFPLLVKRHTKGENFNNLFYLTIILVSLSSISISIFYFIFPAFVINLFLGGREYVGAISYLGLFGLFITLFSILNVLVSFFLSLKKTFISFFVVSAALLQIFLIFIIHDSIVHVISISIFVCSLLLIVLLLYYVKEYGNLKKITQRFSFLNILKI